MFQDDIQKIKDCYIRAIIHITDEKDFEIINEEFFIASNQKGVTLKLEDCYGDTVQYMFNEDIFEQPKEIDKYYELFVKFDIIHSKSWTSCGYEYDSNIDVEELSCELCDYQDYKEFKNNEES